MLIVRLGAAYAAALLVPFPWGLAAAPACALRRQRPCVDMPLLALAALAALLGTLDRAPPDAVLPPAGLAGIARGWIASPPETRGGHSRALLEIESFAALDHASTLPRRARVRIETRRVLPDYGSRLEVQGRLRSARPRRHFHSSGESAFLRAQGACAVLEPDSITVLPGGRGPAWRRATLEPLRQRLAQALRCTLAPGEAGLLSALVLGIRTEIDPRVEEAWRALGLTHILSISGMHIGLLATALLALFGSPRRRRGLLGLLGGVWIYSALGGLGPTVLRASLMTSWAAVALALGRNVRPLTSLATAAALLVLPTPHRRFDLGLQLSCAATTGLLCAAPTLLAWGKRLAHRGASARVAAWAMGGAGIGIAAQMATLPLSLLHFGFVSWVAPLANLVFVPITDAALVLGLVGAPLTLASESLGRPLILASGALLHLALGASVAVASAVPQIFVAPTPTAIALATLAASATLIACILGVPRPRAAWICAGLALLALLALFAFARFPAAPQWQVEALDVGQGDALVLTLGGETWLVDAGDAAPVDRGARVVVPHLRRAGVRRLRGLVLTHPHRDHIGGAAAVLQAFAVDTVYVAAVSAGDSAYARLGAGAPQVPLRGLAAGAQLRLGADCVARVLWPDTLGPVPAHCNDRSLVLWVECSGAPDLLLTGDLEAAGEAELVLRRTAELASLSTRFLVLKAGHHGSSTSSQAFFLDRIRPDVALVSVGVRNRYGHPAGETMAALGRRDCLVLRTDVGGAVRIRLRGASLWLERPGVRAAVLASSPPG